MTQSHPEKVNVEDLEGPALPGLVKRTLESILLEEATEEEEGHYCPPKTLPIIYAIGGIDSNNCAEPVVKYGADGVAVILSLIHI
eukprot:7181990-Ditylum_brightwellii.AAC.1